jgi:hypothetical protein
MVKPASNMTTRWRCTTSARPTIEVAKPNVAAELPAPASGNTNVAARLNATSATRKMLVARAAPPDAEGDGADHRENREIEDRAGDATVLDHA